MKTKEQIENKILSLELFILDLKDATHLLTESESVRLNRQISDVNKFISACKWVLED